MRPFRSAIAARRKKPGAGGGAPGFIMTDSLGGGGLSVAERLGTNRFKEIMLQRSKFKPSGCTDMHTLNRKQKRQQIRPFDYRIAKT